MYYSDFVWFIYSIATDIQLLAESIDTLSLLNIHRAENS